MKIPLALIVSLVSGGAAGAIINQYWANRQTVISYAVNTTSIGAGATARSVLPDLKLQLSGVDIPAVYTHTIELSHDGGPELEHARVSISISGAKQLGHTIAAGPDPVHSILCGISDQDKSSIVCEIGRFTSGNLPYRVVLASDRDSDIAVAMDAKNAVLRRGSNDTKMPIDKVLLFGVMALTALSGLSHIYEGYIGIQRKRTSGREKISQT